MSLINDLPLLLLLVESTLSILAPLLQVALCLPQKDQRIQHNLCSTGICIVLSCKCFPNAVERSTIEINKSYTGLLIIIVPI